MTLILAGLSIELVAGLFTILLKGKRKRNLSAFFSFLALVLICYPSLQLVLNGQPLEYTLSLSEPIGLVKIFIDPLSAFFLILISLGGFLASVYSIEYMKMYEKNGHDLATFYFFLHSLIASMLALVMVHNAIAFLIVWEFISLSSFFLVNFENNKEGVKKAGIYYLVAMQVSAAFLITAFAYASIQADSLDISKFTPIFQKDSGVGVILFILFFLGFGIKAGFMPFHTWLPLAHPAAPSPVSALMSGVMTKIGIYGILRILVIMGAPAKGLAIMVFIVSLASGVFGIVNAIFQKDIKKLLAYSTIENIGIIGMGIGVGMLGQAYHQPVLLLLGYSGALIHIFNHFTFKSLLFYSAGAVYLETRTRNMEALGGLIKTMPRVAILFLTGSIAISGFPLLSGFAGELAIYFAMSKGLLMKNLSLTLISLVGIAGLAFIGVMAMFCFSKVFSISFLGQRRQGLQNIMNDAGKNLLAPMYILSFFIVVIGFFPHFILPFIENISKLFSTSAMINSLSEIRIIYENISKAFLIFGSIILMLFFMRFLLLRKREQALFKTWDCGYQVSSGRFQYSGSSFVAPFHNLAGRAVPQTVQIRKPSGLFPQKASIESKYHDLIELFIIGPMVVLLRKFYDTFAWIQGGKTQRYILYGLIFLFVMIIWIVGTE